MVGGIRIQNTKGIDREVGLWESVFLGVKSDTLCIA